MEQFEINTLVFVGVLLLAIPALMAGFFPFVESSVSLLSDTLGLRSIKGVVIWLLVLGVFLYFGAFPRLGYIISQLRSLSL